jgi:hypothetical protein
MEGGSACRKAAIYTGQHNTEKRGYTSMSRMGFEPMMAVFERAEAVRTADRAATVIGFFLELSNNLLSWSNLLAAFMEPECSIPSS